MSAIENGAEVCLAAPRVLEMEFSEAIDGLSEKEMPEW